jgi:hypothetical protein
MGRISFSHFKASDFFVDPQIPTQGKGIKSKCNRCCALTPAEQWGHPVFERSPYNQLMIVARSDGFAPVSDREQWGRPCF